MICFKINYFSLFVVSLTLFCGIFESHHFCLFISCMVHCTDFSLVRGSRSPQLYCIKSTHLAVKELGSHKVVEYSLCQTEAWPNGLNCGPFELTYHKSMANNTASCVVMLANISKMEPFNDHWSTRCLTGLINQPEWNQNDELLVVL